MDWNLLKENEGNVIFPSDPDPLLNSSFDASHLLSPCNLNQWDAATSTSFDQFASYNFVPTAIKDSDFDGSNLMDTSYNFVSTSSEDPAFKGSKLTDTLEKGLSQLVNGPDCGMLSLDQVDDIFMNSVSDEDICAMVNSVEPSQQVANPCNKPLSFQDMFANPINNVFNQNGMATTSGLDASGISFLSEELSVNSSMMSQGTMASDASTLMNPRGSVTERIISVADVVKPMTFEATALRELEAVLLRINDRTRICFRDAFYRLANESKVLREESNSELLEFHYEPSFNTNSRAYKREPVEYKIEPVEKDSNVIDRAVVNLLFNEMWAPLSTQC